MSKQALRLLQVVGGSMLLVFVLLTLLGGNAQPALAESEPPRVQSVQWGSDMAQPQSIAKSSLLAPSWGVTPTVAYVDPGTSLTVIDSEGYSVTVPGNFIWHPAWVANRFVVVGQISGTEVYLVSYDTWTNITSSIGITGFMPAVRSTTNEMVYVEPHGTYNTVVTTTLVVSGSQLLAIGHNVLGGYSNNQNPSWTPSGRLVVSAMSGYTQYLFERQDNGGWQVLPTSGPNPGYAGYDDGNKLIYQAGNGTGTAVYQNSTVLLPDTMQPGCYMGQCLAVSPANSWAGPHDIVQFLQSGVTRTIATINTTPFVMPAGQYNQLPQQIGVVTASCSSPVVAGEAVTCGVSAVEPSPTGVSYAWNFEGEVIGGQVVTHTEEIAGNHVATLSACNRYGCVDVQAPYTVTVGAAAHIQWVVATDTISAGVELPYEVRVTDVYSNLITNNPNDLNINYPPECDAQWSMIVCTVANTNPGYQFTAQYNYSPELESDLWVKVTPAEVTRVVVGTSIAPAYEMNVGQTIGLLGIGFDQYNNQADVDQSHYTFWSEGIELPNHSYTAQVTGTHVISATHIPSGVEGFTTVVVKPAKIGRIEITAVPANAYYVKSGQSLQLGIQLYDIYGNPMPMPVGAQPIWGIGFNDYGLVEVTQTGLMTMAACSATGPEVTIGVAISGDPAIPATRHFRCQPFGLYLPLVLR